MDVAEVLENWSDFESGESDDSSDMGSDGEGLSDGESFQGDQEEDLSAWSEVKGVQVYACVCAYNNSCNTSHSCSIDELLILMIYM